MELTPLYLNVLQIIKKLVFDILFGEGLAHSIIKNISKVLNNIIVDLN